MVDIQYFRDEELIKKIKSSRSARYDSVELIDGIIQADNKYRKCLYNIEQKKEI